MAAVNVSGALLFRCAVEIARLNQSGEGAPGLPWRLRRLAMTVKTLLDKIFL
jgi:hypothetical protein